MKTLKLAALAITTISMCFGTALADESEQKIEHEMTIQLVVADDGSGDGTTINWTSADPGLDLQNMQVGESRSIIDDSGRSILVTRVEDGLRFDVDGESVVIPDPGDAHGAYMTFVSADGMASIDHDVDIQVMREVTVPVPGQAMGYGRAMARPVAGGVTIITGEPLDAITQESIRAVLQSAGNDEEVTFIDGSSDGTGRHVRLISKEIEVVN